MSSLSPSDLCGIQYFFEPGTPTPSNGSVYVLLETTICSTVSDITNIFGFRIRLLDAITILLPFILETILLLIIIGTSKMRQQPLFLLMVCSSGFDWLARGMVTFQMLTDCLLCTLQGFLDSIGLNASIILQVLLSMHLTFVSKNSKLQKKTTPIVLHPIRTSLVTLVICTLWQVPILPYFKHEVYELNPLFGRCWIPTVSPLARLLSWWAWLPVYLVILTVCAVTVIKNGRKQKDYVLGAKTLGRKTEIRLLLFPVGSIISWLCPAINRLSQAMGRYSHTLESLHSITRGLGGVVFVAILFTNAHFQYAMQTGRRERARKRERGSRSDGTRTGRSDSVSASHRRHGVAASPVRQKPVPDRGASSSFFV